MLGHGIEGPVPLAWTQFKGQFVLTVPRESRGISDTPRVIGNPRWSAVSAHLTAHLPLDHSPELVEGCRFAEAGGVLTLEVGPAESIHGLSLAPRSKAGKICAQKGVTFEDLAGIKHLEILDDDSG